MSLLCVSHIIFAAVLFRTSDGKLHLLPEIGKIPFVDATLIEDPTETSSCDDDDGMVLCTSFFQNQFEIWNIERTTKLRFVFNYWYSLNRSESLCSTSSQTSSEMSDSSATADRSSRQHSGTNYHGLDFQLIVENKSGNGPGKVVHLVAPSMQDKAAWISDISQVVFCFCFFKKCIQQFEMIWFFFFFFDFFVFFVPVISIIFFLNLTSSVSTTCISTTLSTVPSRTLRPWLIHTRCATIRVSSTTTSTFDSAAPSTRAKSVP